MTSEQQAKYMEIFNEFDTDGNGYITREELSNVMVQLGQKPTDDELMEMIREVDDDLDGQINIDEFMHLMARKMKDTTDTDEELAQGFDQFDKNKDKSICIDDLRALMEELGEALTDEDLNDMIRVADLDETGRISFDEFTKVLQTK